MRRRRRPPKPQRNPTLPDPDKLKAHEQAIAPIRGFPLTPSTVWADYCGWWSSQGLVWSPLDRPPTPAADSFSDPSGGYSVEGDQLMLLWGSSVVPEGAEWCYAVEGTSLYTKTDSWVDKERFALLPLIPSESWCTIKVHGDGGGVKTKRRSIVLASNVLLPLKDPRIPLYAQWSNQPLRTVIRRVRS